VSSEDASLRGKDLIDKVIDPEIAAYGEWFAKPEHGASALTPMEVDLMRSYLYQKVTGVL